MHTLGVENHRILDAHKQERAEMKMTEAELMLHNLLKDESVELTTDQLQRVKDTIQATLDLNKELEIQKTILAQNASNANSVFVSSISFPNQRHSICSSKSSRLPNL